VQNRTVEMNSWKIPATELHYYGSYRCLVCNLGVILTMPLPHCSRVTDSNHLRRLVGIILNNKRL